MEMLVALVLTSTIITIVYGSYAAASRSLDLYGSRLACRERTRLVLRLMARQIRCAYVPLSPTGSTPSSPRNTTPSPRPAAFRADARGASGEILSIITTGGLGTRLNEPTPLSHVMYRYDPAGGTLSIYCEPCVYDVDGRQEPGRWRPILSGVRRVDLQFHDGQRWQSQWDSSDSGRLPQAVKIVLTVVDEKDRPHEFGTVVPIGCRNAPQKQQVSTGVGRL